MRGCVCSIDAAIDVYDQDIIDLPANGAASFNDLHREPVLRHVENGQDFFANRKIIDTATESKAMEDRIEEDVVDDDLAEDGADRAKKEEASH